MRIKKKKFELILYQEIKYRQKYWYINSPLVNILTERTTILEIIFL